MVAVDFIQKEYPLHWLVWENNFKDLKVELQKREHDIEKVDNRGRTPLMLAVTLGHLESARALLDFEANVNCENHDGWNVVQEAVSTGDPELLQIILERRDVNRFTSRMAGIPELLQKLKQAPDFYVEMKWEFTSWVPLVSRMCPSDTYKVYKQGSNVRIDTTLLGFDHTSWQRGNRSYVFKGSNDIATMMEIDHDQQQIYVEEMRHSDDASNVLMPTEESVSQRLTTPIVTTYVDTDKISFERNKAGVWGWRSDKTETINGHECKVFSATNVELITKTRTEHLTETDKARCRSNKTPLQNFLGIADVSEGQAAAASPSKDIAGKCGNPYNITAEEYFDESVDLNDRDIGRPKEVNIKVQKFKANLWLCEDYPLSLQEQILPIVDLMAINSTHFAKLKDFIQMQLPSGFPVKIEIPLMHVLNARITFGNIFAIDTPVSSVSRIQEDDRLTCVLDETVFNAPPGYSLLAGGDSRRQFNMEEEDELLQFAIQQSLIDAGTEKEEVDIWEALKAQKPSRPATPNYAGEEERQLQRAIQASLELYQNQSVENHQHRSSNNDEDDENASENVVASDIDSDLHMALLLSEQESKKHQELLKAREEEEQKLLEEILQRSLTEK